MLAVSGDAQRGGSVRLGALASTAVGAASPTDRLDIGRLESYRRELTGYCYRMLASPFDAEDAVQETLLRAWRALERFEEAGGGVRPWLYRIATNVCLDMLKGRSRRVLAVGLGTPAAGQVSMGEPLPEARWVYPISDELVGGEDGDPAVVAIARETVRLAFIAALQLLAPRQRAVLVLHDVLSWRASEIAQLLQTTENAVNAALKRARAALAHADMESLEPAGAEVERELLGRYIDAFERYDVDALVALLHEDAVITMPPFEPWLQGITDIGTFLAAMRSEGGRDRALSLRANAGPAVAVFRPDSTGRLGPYAIMVLEVAGDRIAAIHAFLDSSLFSVFGLGDGDQFSPPAQLEG